MLLTERTPIVNVQGVLSLNYQFNEKHSMGVRYDMDKNFNSTGDWRYTANIYADQELYEKQCKYDDW